MIIILSCKKTNIDFAIRYKNECVPLEVKATNGYAKSLKTVIENKNVYNLKYGYKFGDYNMGVSNNIITAPLYTLFLLDENLAGLQRCRLLENLKIKLKRFI